MRKLVCVLTLLCMLLSMLFTACSPIGNAKVKVNTTDYPCFNFPDVEWGVTKDELFKALGKTAEDFETEKEERQNTSIIRYITEREILGKESLTSFEFCTFSESDYIPLSAVTFIYELGDESYEDFKVKLEELIKSNEADYAVSEPEMRTDENGQPTGESYVIETNMRVKDLPQEVLDNANNYWYYLIENDLVIRNPALKKEDLLKKNWALLLPDEPISKISVQYYSEESFCKVRIDSASLIKPLAQSEIYLKQIRN